MRSTGSRRPVARVCCTLGKAVLPACLRALAKAGAGRTSRQSHAYACVEPRWCECGRVRLEAFDEHRSPDDDDAFDIAPGARPDGRFRFGDASFTPDTQKLAGRCASGSPDAALPVSLLPGRVLVRGARRLAILVKCMLARPQRVLKPNRQHSPIRQPDRCRHTKMTAFRPSLRVCTGRARHCHAIFRVRHRCGGPFRAVPGG
jgi:hypothetical protein